MNGDDEDGTGFLKSHNPSISMLKLPPCLLKGIPLKVEWSGPRCIGVGTARDDGDAEHGAEPSYSDERPPSSAGVVHIGPDAMR